MISFVYVDVGGVAIADFSVGNKWSELKEELGITRETSDDFKAIWEEYETEICLQRDIDTLIPILNEQLHLKLPRDFSLLEAFLKRFEANPAIWPALKTMKQTARIGLLTNMYPRMMDKIIEKDILPPITWDVIIDSSVEGCQKPDQGVFELSEFRAGVPGSQILFIDNNQGHVEAAKQFGWQAFWYDSSKPEQASQELLSFFNRRVV